MNVYAKILEQVRANQPIAVKTTLHGAAGDIAGAMTRVLMSVEPTADSRGRLSTQVTMNEEGDDFIITEPIMPPERLILMGGGHVALSVSEIGAKCGFKVCVVDDRPEFANRQRFPMAEAVICDG